MLFVWKEISSFLYTLFFLINTILVVSTKKINLFGEISLFFIFIYLFFLISKKDIIEKEGSSQKYTGSGHKEPPRQKKDKKLPATQPG